MQQQQHPIFYIEDAMDVDFYYDPMDLDEEDDDDVEMEEAVKEEDDVEMEEEAVEEDDVDDVEMEEEGNIQIVQEGHLKTIFLIKLHLL